MASAGDTRPTIYRLSSVAAINCDGYRTAWCCNVGGRSLVNEDPSRQNAPRNDDARVGLVGKSLGRYRVTAELGRGGMATVYRATDPELGRDVAIKVMHGTFAGRGDLE